MKPVLSDLTAWAQHAGGILREGYGKRHEINHKGRIDLTTEIDHLSEAYLVEQIHARYPGHTIHTEEAGLLSGADGSCWYIDPLDGTTNYAHALPVFCVSLAYTENCKPVLGVVYDPMRDECFSAERGGGAWLNGNSIHVSEAPDLVHSLLVTGFPYDRYNDRRNNLAAFEHFIRLTQGVRRLGAAALDLCYVACGRFEGYWEQTIRPWDIAAGALIVEEAGGRVTRVDGGEDYLRPPCDVLGANPAIHALVLEEMLKLGTGGA
jgi:myo-inositol-1(or 4)-monophosphatase